MNARHRHTCGGRYLMRLKVIDENTATAKIGEAIDWHVEATMPAYNLFSGVVIYTC
jgi:hypothetical protein